MESVILLKKNLYYCQKRFKNQGGYYEKIIDTPHGSLLISRSYPQFRRHG
jgi:hypothetical protein